MALSHFPQLPMDATIILKTPRNVLPTEVSLGIYFHIIMYNNNHVVTVGIYYGN